jgi:CRISPR-associated protein Cas2
MSGVKKFADYAVVYDITDDSEREKVSKLLKDYGFRVQKSVFECRLTKAEKENLIKDLKALNIKTGSVKIYRLEYTWKPCVIGNKINKNPDDDTIYIV